MMTGNKQPRQLYSKTGIVPLRRKVGWGEAAAMANLVKWLRAEGVAIGKSTPGVDPGKRRCAISYNGCSFTYTSKKPGCIKHTNSQCGLSLA